MNCDILWAPEYGSRVLPEQALYSELAVCGSTSLVASLP